MMPIEPDHYGVLELAPGSPLEDVKSQYRRLAKRCHPDLHGNDVRSQETFRRINAAYAFLSDAPRKASYDAGLAAARKRAKTPPTPAPPLRPTPAAPVATGYYASRAALKYHERTLSDLRMTRSAWLGATAGFILVLLVVGLSLDASDRSPFPVLESASPLRDPVPAEMPTDGSGLSADPSPSLSWGISSTDPSRSQSLPHSPRRPAPPVSLRAERLGQTEAVPIFHPEIVLPTPRASEAGLSDALKQQLWSRYRAALPPTDRLLERGHAVRAAKPGKEDEAPRIQQDQLAADLADLRATRTRIPPALARLSRQDTAADLQQKTGPILSDLRHLESSRQSVQADLRALSAPAFTFVQHTRPSVSSVAPPTAAISAPASHLPRTASAAETGDLPKPPGAETAKPKAPTSPGQPFILWGQ